MMVYQPVYGCFHLAPNLGGQPKDFFLSSSCYLEPVRPSRQSLDLIPSASSAARISAFTCSHGTVGSSLTARMAARSSCFSWSSSHFRRASATISATGLPRSAAAWRIARYRCPSPTSRSCAFVSRSLPSLPPGQSIVPCQSPGSAVVYPTPEENQECDCPPSVGQCECPLEAAATARCRGGRHTRYHKSTRRGSAVMNRTHTLDRSSPFASRI